MNIKLTKDHFIEGQIIEKGRTLKIESFQDDWLSAVKKGGGQVSSLVAIFLNSANNTLMASPEYTEQMIEEFVNETIKKSQGKLEFLEIIPIKEFSLRYKRVKEIPMISLSIILKK